MTSYHGYTIRIEITHRTDRLTTFTHDGSPYTITLGFDCACAEITLTAAGPEHEGQLPVVVTCPTHGERRLTAIRCESPSEQSLDTPKLNAAFRWAEDRARRKARHLGLAWGFASHSPCVAGAGGAGGGSS